MRKLLIFITVAASAGLTGCASIQDAAQGIGDPTDLIPSFGVERLPLVYRPEILQGNLLNSKQLEALQVGMTRAQVRFLLGTPMLDDIFHGDRWDYPYTRGDGSDVQEVKRLTLHFEGDTLARIESAYAPDEVTDRQVLSENQVFSVPDWEDPGATLLEKAAKAVGLDTSDEENY